MNEIKCKSVQVTDELLKKLNGFTRREHTADEVYVFSVVLCDNEIDRDGERFSEAALRKMAELFVGTTGVFDHNPSSANQTARIFDTECVTDESKKASHGEPYMYVKALAYMVKTDKNADLIKEIEGGIKKEVSVSCSVAKQTCSVCGKDLRAGRCDHRNGKSYAGVMCCTVLDEPTDAYEWSFVAVPAQRNAGVTKSKSPEGAVEKIKSAQKGISLTAAEVNEIRTKLCRLEEESRYAADYRRELEKEVIRLAYILTPFVPSKIAEESAKALDIESLRELRNSYKSKITESEAQIKKSAPAKQDNSSFKL
ncbi:MAG: hypothetical protein ACI4JX_06590 [Oscillospiraceae bacterium]